jgi:hypothetical protein
MVTLRNLGVTPQLQSALNLDFTIRSSHTVMKVTAQIIQ